MPPPLLKDDIITSMEAVVKHSKLSFRVPKWVISGQLLGFSLYGPYLTATSMTIFRGMIAREQSFLKTAVAVLLRRIVRICSPTLPGKPPQVRASSRPTVFLAPRGSASITMKHHIHTFLQPIPTFAQAQA